MDVKRLKNPPGLGHAHYFDGLPERIRDRAPLLPEDTRHLRDMVAGWAKHARHALAGPRGAAATSIS